VSTIAPAQPPRVATVGRRRRGRGRAGARTCSSLGSSSSMAARHRGWSPAWRGRWASEGLCRNRGRLFGEVRVTVAWELSWVPVGVDLDRGSRGVSLRGRAAISVSSTVPRALERLAIAKGGVLHLGRASRRAPSSQKALVKVVVNVDGGARGNPGPAAVAAVVPGRRRRGPEERGEKIGKATNTSPSTGALLGIAGPLRWEPRSWSWSRLRADRHRSRASQGQGRDHARAALRGEARSGRLRELVDPPRAT